MYIVPPVYLAATLATVVVAHVFDLQGVFHVPDLFLHVGEVDLHRILVFLGGRSDIRDGQVMGVVKELGAVDLGPGLPVLGLQVDDLAQCPWS